MAGLFGFKFVKQSEHDSLIESMTLLQRTVEDLGWNNLGLDQENESKVLLGADFNQILLRSKKMYYNNPLAGHWINLTTGFTFGEGLSLPTAKEPKIQEVIDEFWKDPDNKLSLTSFQAQILISAKLQYEGNLFFVLFVDEEGMVRVRILDTTEIRDIIKLDGDRQRNAFYKVSSYNRKFDFASGAFGIGRNDWKIYADKDTPDEVIKQANIPSDRFVPDAKIYHVKINTDINSKFGIPELHRGNDWISTHKNMAGDLATIISSLSKFTWKKKIKGSAAKVNAIKTAMSTKTDLSNKGPAAGSMQIENEGINLEAMKTPTGGVAIARDGLRQMLLMVSAASGIFEHYFGDPSTGNLATAKSMELPMIKKFANRQKLWTSIYSEILQYQVDQKIAVGKLSGSVEYNAKTERVIIETDLDRVIDIDFPPIVEEDLKATAEALTIAKDSKLVCSKTAAQIFLNSANQNNIDEELEKIEKESAENDNKEEEEGDVEKDKAILAAELLAKAKPKTDKTLLEEAIDTPGDDNAKRLAGKNKYAEHRMNSYRKALAGNFYRFRSNVMSSLVSDGSEDQVVGNIPDLKPKIKTFTDDMQSSAKKFFPEAINIGSQFLVKHLSKAKAEQKLKLTEASKDINKLLGERLDWNNKYLTEGFAPAIETKLLDTLRQPYKDDRLLRAKVGESLATFDSRVEQYVGAFWTVEESAVRATGKGSGLMVNFAGPEDADNCAGCASAIASNPHLIDDAPLPGEQDCLGRCRHALQVISEE